MKTSILQKGFSMLGMTLSLLSVLLWTGCTKPDIPTTTPSLTVDVTEVNLAPNGETAKIPIISNTDLAEPICSHEWITAVLKNDNRILEITAAANPEKEIRTGNVTLQTKSDSGDDISKTIKVTQGVQDMTFKFDQDTYDLGYAEGTAQVSLLSKGKWEISQEKIPGWLEVTPTSGDGDASISVRYKSNVSINERNSQVMFKNSTFGNSTVLKLKQAGNPKGLSDFSHLGKGYDAMGSYANDVDVRAAVLDCQKLYEANDIADPINSYYTEEDNICGNSREEYMSAYNASASIEGHVFGFSASVNASFSQSALSTSENSFGTFRHLTKKQVIKLHDSLRPEDLHEFISDAFKKDVQSLTAEQLVAKYGTHTILGLSLGGVLEYSMTADASSTSSSFNLSVAMKAGYESSAYGGSVSGSFEGYEELKKSDETMEQHLTCRGGDSQFASSGFGSESTYKEWLASLNDINKWVMIDFEGNQLVALDKFIEDQGKAAEVKAYIAEYMSSDKLPRLSSRYRTFQLEITQAELNFTRFGKGKEGWMNNVVSGWTEGMRAYVGPFELTIDDKNYHIYMEGNYYWSNRYANPLATNLRYMTRDDDGKTCVRSPRIKMDRRKNHTIKIDWGDLTGVFTYRYNPNTGSWTDSKGKEYKNGDFIKITENGGSLDHSIDWQYNYHKLTWIEE